MFRPDYRGHDRSEGRAVGAYFSPAYTVDVLNAVASLKALDGADPERIGMWGHSMGGGITLRAMVVAGEIKAGVIWAGVVAPYSDLFERFEKVPEPQNHVLALQRRRRLDFLKASNPRRHTLCLFVGSMS